MSKLSAVHRARFGFPVSSCRSNGLLFFEKTAWIGSQTSVLVAQKTGPSGTAHSTFTHLPSPSYSLLRLWPLHTNSKQKARACPLDSLRRQAFAGRCRPLRPTNSSCYLPGKTSPWLRRAATLRLPLAPPTIAICAIQVLDIAALA